MVVQYFGGLEQYFGELQEAQITSVAMIMMHQLPIMVRVYSFEHYSKKKKKKSFPLPSENHFTVKLRHDCIYLFLLLTRGDRCLIPWNSDV